MNNRWKRVQVARHGIYYRVREEDSMKIPAGEQGRKMFQRT